MGCDIHFVTEIKAEKFGWVGTCSTSTIGQWANLNELRLSPLRVLMERDYEFFTKLAGVRGTTGPTPNGLPLDASELTRALCWDMANDGHSHGHCSLRKFVEAKLKCVRFIRGVTATKLAGDDPVAKFLEGLFHKEALDQFRVCFWFDN